MYISSRKSLIKDSIAVKRQFNSKCLPKIEEKTCKPSTKDISDKVKTSNQENKRGPALDGLTKPKNEEKDLPEPYRIARRKIKYMNPEVQETRQKNLDKPLPIKTQVKEPKIESTSTTKNDAKGEKYKLISYDEWVTGKNATYQKFAEQELKKKKRIAAILKSEKEKWISNARDRWENRLDMIRNQKENRLRQLRMAKEEVTRQIAERQAESEKAYSMWMRSKEKKYATKSLTNINPKKISNANQLKERLDKQNSCRLDNSGKIDFGKCLDDLNWILHNKYLRDRRHRARNPVYCQSRCSIKP